MYFFLTFIVPTGYNVLSPCRGIIKGRGGLTENHHNRKKNKKGACLWSLLKSNQEGDPKTKEQTLWTEWIPTNIPDSNNWERGLILLRYCYVIYYLTNICCPLMKSIDHSHTTYISRFPLILIHKPQVLFTDVYVLNSRTPINFTNLTNSKGTLS